MSSDTATGTVTDPGQVIVIDDAGNGRFTSRYREWNGQWRECRDHDHITRETALTCAERRIRYRS